MKKTVVSYGYIMQRKSYITYETWTYFKFTNGMKIIIPLTVPKKNINRFIKSKGWECV